MFMFMYLVFMSHVHVSCTLESMLVSLIST